MQVLVTSDDRYHSSTHMNICVLCFAVLLCRRRLAGLTALNPQLVSKSFLRDATVPSDHKQQGFASSLSSSSGLYRSGVGGGVLDTSPPLAAWDQRAAATAAAGPSRQSYSHGGSGSGSGSGVDGSGSGGDRSLLALDLTKVYSLQRDLVKFSHAAFEFSHLCGSTSHNGCGNNSLVVKPSTAATLTSGGDRAATLSTLQDSARNLLVRTSSFAPLAPVALPPPFTSSYSGLKCLIAEVTTECCLFAIILLLLQVVKLCGKRGAGPELQACVDRSVSEQTVLLTALHKLKVCLLED